MERLEKLQGKSFIVNDVNLHDAPKVTEADPNKQLAFTSKSKRLAKTQKCF